MKLFKSLLKIGLATTLLSSVGLALQPAVEATPTAPHLVAHAVAYRLAGPPPSEHTGITGYLFLYLHPIDPVPTDAA